MTRMRIWLTSFYYDGKEHGGPNIIAENIEKAETIASKQGVVVQGELTDVYDFTLEDRIVH